jgi:hypothetical protein
MTSNLKYFSVDEAEAAIPKLTELLTSAAGLKAQIESRAEEWRSTPESHTDAKEALLHGQIDFLISQLDQKLQAITALGCLPKDIEQGLVDFPARRNGREIYLCWRLGETRITAYHAIGEGFASRQPLDERKA